MLYRFTFYHKYFFFLFIEPVLKLSTYNKQQGVINDYLQNYKEENIYEGGSDLLMILLRYKKFKKAYVPLWHCEFLICHTLFSCHGDKNNKGPSLLCVFTWQWVIIGMTLFITINRRWHISTTPNTTKKIVYCSNWSVV